MRRAVWWEAARYNGRRVCYLLCGKEHGVGRGHDVRRVMW